MSNNVRYSGRFGCKYGLPHDLKILHDTKSIKVEVCKICNKKFRWNKSARGRIKNTDYLRAHVRNFCQKFGATKRIYHKIYKPEKTKIII